MSSSATTDLPRCIVKPATGEHKATVIFLHGLGDTAENFSFLHDVANKSGFKSVKWIFPAAPVRPITANSGYTMPAWFDYLTFDFERPREDEAGLIQASNWVKQLVQNELTQSNIPASQIAIGGFSQGGATSFLATFTLDEPIAGFFGLGTYVPLSAKVLKGDVVTNPRIKTTPIFWGHGMADPLLDHAFGLKTAKSLAEQLGIGFVHTPAGSAANWTDVRPTLEQGAAEGTLGLRFHSYRGVGHSIDEGEWNDFALWLSVVLKIPEHISKVQRF